MKRLLLGLSILLMGAPATAVPLPPVYVDRYDSSIAGEPIVSLDIFYDQLSPYGVWVDEPSFGQVFIPDQQRFVPYADGRWEYTNVGFVWVSSEPFAWATTHYGRWAYSQYFQRWVWIPDTVWGPSWVEWRQYGDYFGWAPLGPDISIGYASPIWSWHYTSARRLFDPNVSRYYESPRRVRQFHRGARPIQHYANIGGARVVVGPPLATLRDRRVSVRPTVIDPRAAGRWTPAESRAALRRAQERRWSNDALNRERIERNPRLRRPSQLREVPPQRPQLRQVPPQRPQLQQRPQLREVPPQRPQLREVPPQRPQLRQVPRPPPQTRPELRQPPQLRQEPRQPPQVPQEPRRRAPGRTPERR